MRGTKRDRDEDNSAMDCEGHQADAAPEPKQPFEKQQRNSQAAATPSSDKSCADPADYEGACMVYVSASSFL